MTSEHPGRLIRQAEVQVILDALRKADIEVPDDVLVVLNGYIDGKGGLADVARALDRITKRPPAGP